MATMRTTMMRSSATACRSTAVARPTAVLRATVRPAISVQAQKQDSASAIAPAIALSAAVSNLMVSGNALAATELAQIAAGDNRANVIFLLFVPALAWVGFNILGGLTGQLDRMSEEAAAVPPERRSIRKKRGIAAGLGLGAAGLLAASPAAQAATELTQLAAGDNRANIIFLLFVPALAWVGFNILGGLTGQLDRMSEEAAAVPPERRSIRKARGVAAGLGLGTAGLLAASPAAQAATELTQLAAGDNRANIIFLLFVPALAWVAFNILGGLTGQLDRMSEEAAAVPPSRRSIRK